MWSGFTINQIGGIMGRARCCLPAKITLMREQSVRGITARQPGSVNRYKDASAARQRPNPTPPSEKKILRLRGVAVKSLELRGLIARLARCWIAADFSLQFPEFDEGVRLTP
jgi:hypothetical protein